MKVLVTAAQGQVGHALTSMAKDSSFDIVSLPRQQLDITNKPSIQRAMEQIKPDILVNAAAYTAVDKAEADQDAAYRVNEMGSANLAHACHQSDIPLIHISTDYVYSGDQPQPYVEGDTPHPVNVYGASKLAGDKAIASIHDRHIILRTSWVFGLHGNNFVKTMLHLGKERDELGVIDDQYGCPTAAEDIAETVFKLCKAIQSGKAMWGLYHYCGQPAISWYGFACRIFERAKAMGFDLNIGVKPITTEDYPTPAKRPKSTILDCRRIKTRYNIEQPDWHKRLDAIILAEFAAEPSSIRVRR